MNVEPKNYTLGEEIASSVTHGIGFLLAVAALSVMVVFAALNGTAWHVVSCSIYGATLVLLFAASTLYHSFPWPRVKAVFKVIDHSAIYLLIAGTYTPFLLVPLRGPWGWSLFGVVWVDCGHRDTSALGKPGAGRTTLARGRRYVLYRWGRCLSATPYPL